MPEINWLAVLVAALSSFVLGGLWYSPALFMRAWQLGAGVTDEQIKSGNMVKIFGGSLVLAILAATTFAMFLGPDVDAVTGASYGFVAGLFWVAGSFGINYLNERRPLSLWLINGGYHTLQFTLYGLVLGLWH